MHTRHMSEVEIAVGPRTLSEQFQVLAMQVFFCAANLSDQVGMACLLNYSVLCLIISCAYLSKLILTTRTHKGEVEMKHAVVIQEERK